MSNKPKLAYLTDLNISPKTVRDLQQQGMDIERADKYLPSNAPDAEILEFARKNKLVVITQDLDFSILVALSGVQQPSLITLRLARSDPQKVTTRLLEELPLIEDELHQGYAITIQDATIRLRKLPIS